MPQLFLIWWCASWQISTYGIFPSSQTWAQWCCLRPFLAGLTFQEHFINHKKSIFLQVWKMQEVTKTYSLSSKCPSQNYCGPPVLQQILKVWKALGQLPTRKIIVLFYSKKIYWMYGQKVGMGSRTMTRTYSQKEICNNIDTKFMQSDLRLSSILETTRSPSCILRLGPQVKPVISTMQGSYRTLTQTLILIALVTNLALITNLDH